MRSFTKKKIILKNISLNMTLNITMFDLQSTYEYCKKYAYSYYIFNLK